VSILLRDKTGTHKLNAQGYEHFFRSLTTMSIDKHTFAKWVAGAEPRLTKTHRPFAGVPLIGRIKAGAKTQEYVLKLKNLTYPGRGFSRHKKHRRISFASIQLPIWETRIGNDVGRAVASFNYTTRRRLNITSLPLRVMLSAAS